MQPNVAPDPATGANPVLIDDFSGTGTLELGNVQLRTGDPRWFDPQGQGYNFTNSGVGWSVTTTLGSGTGDIQLSSPVTFIGNSFQHINIIDLVGVNSVTFEINFDVPLAPVRAFTSGVPFVGAVRSPIDGFTAATTTTLINPIFLTDNDPTPGVLDISTSSGIPAGSDLIQFGLGGGDWTDSNSHSWTLTGNASTANYGGIAFLDLNGDGVADQPDGPTVVNSNANDGNLDEIERFYASGMRFEFTHTTGTTFADGSSFQFSFNGAQYEDSLAVAKEASIPEPSGTLLIALGGLSLLGRRRRS